MKNIFKIILIIFALAISFLIKPQVFHQEQTKTVSLVQTIKKESTFLITNNKLNEEISSPKNGNSTNTNGTSAIIIPFFTNNNLFSIDKTPIIWCFIHNFSRLLINGKYIRAP